MRQGKNTSLAWTAIACAALLSACSTTKEFIVLLPEENGKVGAVAIEAQQHTTILNTPLAIAKIDTQSRVQQDRITQEEANEILKPVQDTLPPPSLCFTLYFDEKSTEIMPRSRADLEALLAEVAKRPVVEVQITGHTDTVGPQADNDRLSLERARAVQDMLVKNGLHAKFIRAVGRGERELLKPTPDETPEEENRRVEVIVR